MKTQQVTSDDEIRLPSVVRSISQNRNHQQTKKKMDCKLNLGQLVDRHDSAMLTAYFDALFSKYERAETSKLLASGITMVAGGNIKTRTPNPCYGRIDYVQALPNDVGND